MKLIRTERETQREIVNELNLGHRIRARRRAVGAAVGIAASATILAVALAQRGGTMTARQEPGGSATATEAAAQGPQNERTVTLLADDGCNSSDPSLPMAGTSCRPTTLRLSRRLTAIAEARQTGTTCECAVRAVRD